MGYLLLAVVFYTVVRFGVDVWLQFRYEKNTHQEKYDLEEKVMTLNKEIAELKKAK